MARQHDLYLEPYPGAGNTGLEPAFRQSGFGGKTVIPNLYRDWNFWQDNTEWPHASRIMDQSAHPEWLEHLWSMSAGDKTEMTAEWSKTYNVNYGGITCQMSTAAQSCGFGLVRDGRYVPNFVAGGYTTNNDDWSVKYDAIRGHFYSYWKDDQPSDSHRWMLGCRPTAGSVNHGALAFDISRNYTNKWRVYLVDGNGNTTNTYLLGSPLDQADCSCHLQFEFVKGSHVTLKLKTRVAGVYNWSSFTAPTWPIAETGYYVTIDLTGVGLRDLTPITPYFYCASSFEYSNGYVGRMVYELRGIGNEAWGTLV